MERVLRFDPGTDPELVASKLDAFLGRGWAVVETGTDEAGGYVHVRRAERPRPLPVGQQVNETR